MTEVISLNASSIQTKTVQEAHCNSVSNLSATITVGNSYIATDTQQMTNDRIDVTSLIVKNEIMGANIQA